MNDGDVELSENDVATDVGCWVGELCGELLAKDERSDPLFIDTRSLSVKRPGQNSKSSSRSNDRVASNFMRKLLRGKEISISFLPERNLCWRFCVPF